MTHVLLVTKVHVSISSRGSLTLLIFTRWLLIQRSLKLPDMTDLTSTLSSLLTTTHNSKPISPVSPNLDSFLLEARQINTSIRSLLLYLRALRGPYLSDSLVAPNSRRSNPLSLKSSQLNSTIATPLGPIPNYLSNPQRESIDTHTSTLLRDLSSNITNLRNAANLAHETARQRLDRKYGAGNSKRKSLLFRWAAGEDSTNSNVAEDKESRAQEEGAEETRHNFRDGVLWYLNHKLAAALSTQQRMITIRLEREREKRASILYDEINRHVRLPQQENSNTAIDKVTQSSTSTLDFEDMQSHDLYDPSLASPTTHTTPTTSQLSEDQLLLFAHENSSLLNHYTSQLAQVTHAESSLLEISALQQTLLTHLSTQSEMIEHLVVDAQDTDQDLGKGNKELKRASERTRTARLVYHVTLWVCGGLIVWDLIF